MGRCLLFIISFSILLAFYTGIISNRNISGRTNMELKSFLSAASSVLQAEAEKNQKNVLKKLRQTLPQKSDSEIRDMYRVRYDKPNWNDEIIALIEREASRRGIC